MPKRKTPQEKFAEAVNELGGMDQAQSLLTFMRALNAPAKPPKKKTATPMAAEAFKQKVVS